LTMRVSPLAAGQSHMTEDEKGETIRMHLSLIMQHLLPSHAIALPLVLQCYKSGRTEGTIHKEPVFHGVSTGQRQDRLCFVRRIHRKIKKLRLCNTVVLAGC
jgi:hypothetical protein